MELKKVFFVKGIMCLGDHKDIPDGSCHFQQDFINSPATAITTRPGFTKVNSTGLGSAIKSVFQFKTIAFDQTLAADAAGNIHTL